jgi:hypothetical protein
MTSLWPTRQRTRARRPTYQAGAGGRRMLCLLAGACHPLPLCLFNSSADRIPPPHIAGPVWDWHGATSSLVLPWDNRVAARYPAGGRGPGPGAAAVAAPGPGDRTAGEEARPAAGVPQLPRVPRDGGSRVGGVTGRRARGTRLRRPVAGVKREPLVVAVAE